MIYLIIGYVYLMIHRPMEIWPALEPLRIELIYFSMLCAAWLVAAKRLTIDMNAIAIGMLGAVVYAAWILSPWANYGEIPVKNYTLVFAFGLILATALRDERAIHRVIVAFLVVMAIYMLHSVWEYRNGRHVYRMGISRLVGVDSSLGDPNSFGASIVYSLPFVRYLWFAWGAGWRRKALVAYTILAMGCIGLTGSRSSLVGLLLWMFLTVVLTGNKRLLWLVGGAMAAVVGFMILPEELQTRFQTIVDPSVGPENARQSGQGRIMGLIIGLNLWSRFPLTGVGPGAWRPASGMKIESHSLYGQMVGELGTAGLIAFGLLIASIAFGLRRLFTMLRANEANPKLTTTYHLAQAIGMSTLLLLFEGLFGHNLYRYNYVWYAAFTSVLLRSYKLQCTRSPALAWQMPWRPAWA